MSTLEKLFENEEFRDYLQRGDVFLQAIGYNEHGDRHVKIVAANAMKILRTLGHPEDRVILAGLAGALHDIGYIISKENHEHYGAILARDLLRQLGVDFKSIGTVMSAIANSGNARIPVFSDVHAALVLADQADVDQSRLRKLRDISGELNDKVHIGVQRSQLEIDGKARTISVDIQLDTSVISMMEYFNIYLERAQNSKNASKFLDCAFRVIINNVTLD